MQITFVCAPPGCGLRGACDRVCSLAVRRSKGPVAHEDVESFLDDSIRVTVSYPRPRAISEWQAALATAISTLSEAKAPLGVLSGHLTLFSEARSEFFSAVAPDALRHLGPRAVSRVVVLIDDVFDMYRRLARRGEIYYEAAGLDRQRRLELEFRSVPAGPPLTELDEWVLGLEYRVSTVQQLMAWRRAEMVQADLLARQLGCPLTVLGVKHAAEVLAPLFLENADDVQTAYVSHPISGPRREHRQTGEWPALVASCNRIPKTLATWNTAAVMPSAIDEYRIQPGAGSRFSRSPLLDPRWPAQDSDSGPVIVEPSHVSSDRSILLPDLPPDLPDVLDGVVGGLSRTLEDAIRSEIPFRDHLLVSSCTHLIVFRPLYHDGTFSRSVSREIRYWAQLADHQKYERRAAFLHSPDDVRLAVAALLTPAVNHAQFSEELRTLGVRALRQLLAETLPMAQLTEDDLRRLLGGGIPESHFSRWALSEAQTADLRNTALRGAAIEGLVTKLTALPSREDTAVFLLSDMDGDLSGEIVEGVVAFLQGDAPPAVVDMVEPVLDADLVSWARLFLGDSGRGSL